MGEGEGYWAHREMQWSQGPKMCHECFLKLLVLVESNSSLYRLLSALKQVETGSTYSAIISKFEEQEFVSLIKEPHLVLHKNLSSSNNSNTLNPRN
ncbi:MAG: hypothetical protein DRO98_03275 [Archaeoglobales archaeon]|nr:MAG: hypothetical protein DRO98_03275 [Archaeoglobales archaeon]